MDKSEAAALVQTEGERLLSFLRNNSGALTGAAAEERAHAFAAQARKLAAAASGVPELKAPVLEVIQMGKECLLHGVTLSLVASAMDKLKAACGALLSEKKPAPDKREEADDSSSKVQTWGQVSKDPAMSPRRGGSSSGVVSPRPSVHDSAPGVSPRPLPAVGGTSPRPLRQAPGSSSEKLPQSRGPAGVSQAAVATGRVQVVAAKGPASMDLDDVEKLFGEEVSFESTMAKSPGTRRI